MLSFEEYLRIWRHLQSKHCVITHGQKKTLVAVKDLGLTCPRPVKVLRCPKPGLEAPFYEFTKYGYDHDP